MDARGKLMMKCKKKGVRNEIKGVKGVRNSRKKIKFDN